MAILFLVAYHCFSSADRLNGSSTITFYPLSDKTAFTIFESMNICVGMFAFLSAYGLMKTLSYKDPELNLSAGYCTDFIIKRVISLLGAFFMPFLIGEITTVAILKEHPYGEGLTMVMNMLADMLGLGGILRTPMLIGTWWYMSFAIVIICFVPFAAALYKKFGAASIVPFALLPVLFDKSLVSAAGTGNMTRWFLTISLGVIFAESDLLVKLKKQQLCKDKKLSKLLKFVIMTVVLFALFRLRISSWGMEHFHYYISSILPVFFVCYMFEFINDIPIVNTVLAFFGDHSSNIFFIHTFIRARWFPKFTYSFKYPIVTYLFMLALSIAISYFIKGVDKLLKRDAIVKKITESVLKKRKVLLGD